MKHFIFGRILTFFGLILTVVGGPITTQARATEVIVFSALEDSGPQEVAKLVLREAYERIGFTVRFSTLPGERALLESNAGRTDGEVARIGGIEKKYKTWSGFRYPSVIWTGSPSPGN